jgi:hypothetical protein
VFFQAWSILKEPQGNKFESIHFIPVLKVPSLFDFG